MRTKTTAFLALAMLGLQGCAAMEGAKSSNTTNTANTTQVSNTDQAGTVPSSDYLNRDDVASPAARISGGSGASHSGMSNVGGHR